MKTLKGKSLIALLAAMLLIVSTVGLTVAYFSDTDKAEGEGALNLNAQTVIDEGSSETEKNVVITNNGNADVLVRVRFFGPEGMVVTAPSGWQEADGWYYYTKVVTAPDGNTGKAINAKIAFEGTKEEVEKKLAELGDEYDITVVHEAAIVTYDGDNIATPSGWDSSVKFSY